MAVDQNQLVPNWGRCTTHFRTYFSGDWDVHWGYDLDLDFDPWPHKNQPFGMHEAPMSWSPFALRVYRSLKTRQCRKKGWGVCGLFPVFNRKHPKPAPSRMNVGELKNHFPAGLQDPLLKQVVSAFVL